MGENTKNLAGGLIGTAVSFSGMTLEQADHLVSLICGIIGLIITICTCVVIPVAKKIIAARRDHHISADEAEDILDTLKDGLDKVNQHHQGDKKDHE